MRDGSARDARILTFLGAVDVALLRHIVHTCFLSPGPSTAAAFRRASTLAARRLGKFVARGYLRRFPGPKGHAVYALSPAGGAGVEAPPLLQRARQARLAATLGQPHPLLSREALAALHRALPGEVEVIGFRACYAANRDHVGRKIPDGGLAWWPPGAARPLTLWLEIVHRPLCPTAVPRWRRLTERFLAAHPGDRILYVLGRGRPARILELAAESSAAPQLLAVHARDLLTLAPEPPAAVSNGRGGVVVRPLSDALLGGPAGLVGPGDQPPPSGRGAAEARHGPAPEPTLAAAIIGVVEDALHHGLSLEEAAAEALAAWPHSPTLPAVAAILHAEFGIAAEALRPLASPRRPSLF